MKKCILIVEDADVWQDILSERVTQAVEEMGYNPDIHTAKTYASAKDLMNKRKWDLIITDIGLGEKSEQKLGMRLAESAFCRKVPCIVVSGTPILRPRDVRDLIREHRVHDFFSKEAFDSKEFIREVQTVLDERPALFKDGLSHAYAFIVAVANYACLGPLPDVVSKDAWDLRNTLLSKDHCGYLTDHVRIRRDSEATAECIREGLRWLAEVCEDGKTALFYFSGHGGQIGGAESAENYLLPFECNPSSMAETAIAGSELSSLLKKIRASKLLIFFDCCFSGGLGELKAPSARELSFKSGLDERYYAQLTKGIGRVIIASSRSDEFSWVREGLENSLFTHYLLEALQGKAHTRGDGLIRVFDVFDYISEKVPAHEPRQHPIFKADDLESNFPIALHRGGK
ncbi:MAG: caspase family protein [Syntrophobacter sp.]